MIRTHTQRQVRHPSDFEWRIVPGSCSNVNGWAGATCCRGDGRCGVCGGLSYDSDAQYSGGGCGDFAARDFFKAYGSSHPSLLLDNADGGRAGQWSRFTTPTRTSRYFFHCQVWHPHVKGSTAESPPVPTVGWSALSQRYTKGYMLYSTLEEN